MKTFRAQIPNGQIVVLSSATDHPIDPASLVIDALSTPQESRRTSVSALIRDLFPGAFPDLVDCRRRPLLDPDITFGDCNAPRVSEPFEGWAFWNKDPKGDDDVFVNLVSHECPSGLRTTSESIHAWRSQQGSHSLDVEELGFVMQEFHVVGRRGEHEWLDSEDHPVFISWDHLIERCTPGLAERSAETPSILLIDEIVASARRVLAMVARDPRTLYALDGRRFEESAAVLLSDLGFDVVELTRPGKDGGRDLVVRRRDPESGSLQTLLVECKHWTSGKAVGLEIALHLLDVVSKEDAKGGVLIATSGFTPTLIELQARLERQHLHLKGGGDFLKWLQIWERRFASPVFTPVDPLEILSGGTGEAPASREAKGRLLIPL